MLSIALFIALKPLHDRIASLPILVQYPITTIFRVIPSYIFFVVGVFLFDFFARISNMESQKKAILGVLAAFGTVFINITFDVDVNMHLMKITNPVAFLLTGILGSFSVIVLSMLFCKDTFRLGCIGKKSLKLMALHYPPIPIIKVSSILCALCIGKENNGLIFFLTLICLLILETCYEFILKIIISHKC